MTNTAAVHATSGVSDSRYLPFRLVCTALAAVFLVAFGMWRTWLTPWITFADDADHGWTRTPELHRWADSASGAFYLMLSIGLLLLVVSPRHRSGLTAWVVFSLTANAALAVPASLLQEHQGPIGAILTALLILAVFTGPLVLTAPHRAAVLRGGQAVGRPVGPTRWLLPAGTVSWVAVGLAALVWRLSGGMVESPREDDVVAFLALSTSAALACLTAWRGRESWQVLAGLAGGVTAYALVASVFLLLG